MPTVQVARRFLFQLLEQEFSQEQFEDLCFQFGVELDDVTSEHEIAMKELCGKGETPLSDEAIKSKLEGKSKEVLYKIDTPANRYDLLSAEGLAIALKVFLERMPVPKIRLLPPQYTMTVSKNLKGVRDFVVCAVLRDICFTPDSYKSFIDFQEKLHSGLARKRTLASVGTHNLDKCVPPFFFKCVPKQEIKFVPLSQERELNCAGSGLEDFYQADRNISKYVPLISSFPAYPVISDTTGKVLSLPPIINSEHSKIDCDTKNIFIECTAPDHYKAHVLVNQMVSAFSMYAKEPFTVEGVKIDYEDGATTLGKKFQSEITPNLTPRAMSIDAKEASSRVGVEVSADRVAKLLCQMLYETEVVEGKSVRVQIPASRSDVIHECDLYEDIAIAYGYEQIHKFPCPTFSQGSQTPMNKMSHLVRLEIANAGYTEILTFALCSRDEAFANLNRTDKEIAVHIANPQTKEFQIARPSLLPGMMKTLHANRSVPLPLKFFEVSDVVIQDPTARTRTRNERHLCAAHCAATGSGFEDIHGLAEFALLKIGVAAKTLGATREQFVAANSTVQRWYELNDEACHDDAFFRGRRMTIVLVERDENGAIKTQEIGSFGVLHPHVLKSFDFPFPTSYCEINLEPLL